MFPASFNIADERTKPDSFLSVVIQQNMQQ